MSFGQSVLPRWRRRVVQRFLGRLAAVALLLVASSVVWAERPELLIEQCETFEHGEPEHAIELANRSLELLEEGDTWLRFQALGCKAWALSALGQRAQATLLTRQLDQLLAGLVQPDQRVRALRRKSALYHRLGDRERSTELLRVALELAEAENLPAQRIDLLTNLGASRAEARQYELAISHLNQALELVGREGEERQGLPIRYNLGLVYRSAGRLEEAAEMLLPLREPLSAPGMEIRLASLNSALGAIHHELGRYDEAHQFFATSRRLHERLDNPAEYAALLIDLTRLKIDTGEIEEALVLSEQAVAEARRADFHFSIAGALDVRADALEAAGKLDQALAVERERARLVEQFLVDQQRSQIDELEAELGVALRERELAGLRIERETQARRLESQQQRQRLLVVVLVGLVLIGFAVTAVQWFNNRRLARWSRTDALTGLDNRRQANEWLAEATDTELLMLVDLDNFKEINDTHGHAFGDRVLSEVGSCLARFADQHGGRVARWGGEEFLVIVPGQDAEHAKAVGRALRETVAAIEIKLRGGPRLALTASIGLLSVGAAASDRDVSGWESALLLADELMYQAKHAGRNRTVVLWPEGEERFRVADLKSGQVVVEVV